MFFSSSFSATDNALFSASRNAEDPGEFWETIPTGAGLFGSAFKDTDVE
jgi:hypothetical protein